MHVKDSAPHELFLPCSGSAIPEATQPSTGSSVVRLISREILEGLSWKYINPSHVSLA